MARSRSFNEAVEHLRGDSDFCFNITAWNTTEARTGETAKFPDGIHPALIYGLNKQGITNLYVHQADSWKAITSGKNVAIVTGTSSGKSLCYNIPVINEILQNLSAKALYLFPTKALANDQNENLNALFKEILCFPEIPFVHNKNIAATYDGDTPSHIRKTIREISPIIITNPDMLHLGILPHHTQWEEFFRGLRFVIIDEVHTYRGVFGSHVCNVLRRLKRVSRFYQSDPQFIITSATIGNPGELAEKLIEKPIEIIDTDGSPHGERHFVIYNPPIENPDLNLRRKSFQETANIAKIFYEKNVQTIIFCPTRRSVELLLIFLQKILNDEINSTKSVRGYRSGYLAAYRRKLEKGLKQGDISIIIATTALELGIDCGEIDAVILEGFPGTISGTRQQSGRAGRKYHPSIAILITNENPVDQFLARNPSFLFSQNPEKALINPDNVLILLEHIKCALFELPFYPHESFGNLNPSQLSEFLVLLENEGLIKSIEGKFFWTSSQYPANEISLRNASASKLQLLVHEGNIEKNIGEIDKESVYWMTHPGAVYLHDGDSYLVDSLEIDNLKVNLSPFIGEYHTKPQQSKEVEFQNERMREDVPGGQKLFGDLLITEQVIGFHKIRWGYNDILESMTLSMPLTQLNTMGYLFFFHKETIDCLRDQGVWTNDRKFYGPEWNKQRQRALARDGFCCQSCGRRDQLHVHHKIPFRMFQNHHDANQLENLITLCPPCHTRSENSVRVRSGLAGLTYIISHIAPLSLMCDQKDIGVHFDPQSRYNSGEAALFVYDRISGGLGFSQEIYYSHRTIMKQAHDLAQGCDCFDGCPSCVGPGGELGMGSKKETLALLRVLISESKEDLHDIV